MFTVRRYTPTDQAAVEHLHVFVIQQTGAYLGRGPWDDDVYAIEDTYLNDQGEFLIGEEDGKIVAMGALKRSGAEQAELKRMRILPEYQRHGYGQRMLTELEARARQLGYRTLHLDTSILQVPAQRLYEKNGYHEVGRTFYEQHIDKDTSQPIEVLLYEKQLVP